MDKTTRTLLHLFCIEFCMKLAHDEGNDTRHSLLIRRWENIVGRPMLVGDWWRIIGA